VELDPQNPRAHNNLGWVLLAIGNIEDAIRHFEKALELDPNDELARTNLNRARSMSSAPAAR
jgi:Flp pilus assembly protein TadD